MRRIMLSFFTIALLALTVTGLFAYGKTTVDPNAAKIAQSDAPKMDVDKRLAQKVTYEAKKKSVLAILTDLSDETGVTFKAGYNNKDWQVRDRKMNIFAKDVPLADLMASIAHVMKFKWSRGDESENCSYRLYMDRKTLLDAESQRLREEERAQREQSEKREKMLNDFANLDKLSPQDLAKLKQDNPFMYIAQTSGLAGPLGAFFGEMPFASEALASGQPLNMSAGNMSAAAQKSLLGAMGATAALMAKLSGGRTANLPQDIENNLAKVTVKLNEHLEMAQSMGGGANFLLGEMNMSYDGKDFNFPFIDPSSKIAKLLGKAIVKSDEEQVPFEDVIKNMQGEMMSAYFSDIQSGDPEEKSEKRPDDPALLAKIKMKSGTGQLDGVLGELAKASGIAVVSDSFGRTHGVTSVGDEAEIRDILDKIAIGYRYKWDKPSSIIEFRDKLWFKKRAAQLPDAQLEGWRKTLRDTGTLDINDLADIAELTYEQITLNFQDDEVLGQDRMNAIFGSRETLRFYNMLSDSQRSALFSESGLMLDSLSPEQYDKAAKLIQQRNAAFMQNPDAKVTFTANRKQFNKQFDKEFEYTFTASSEGLSPVKWGFTMPHYEVPKKEEPKKPETEKK